MDYSVSLIQNIFSQVSFFANDPSSSFNTPSRVKPFNNFAAWLKEGQTTKKDVKARRRGHYSGERRSCKNSRPALPSIVTEENRESSPLPSIAKQSGFARI